jgi:TM2 domain-containing membrane protein YozV
MVFATPDIIKQAVAGSHVAVWRQPVFSRANMLIFTVLIGSFGLHHVMLRSPLTGFLFLLLNTATWGYWWFFDIMQLAFSTEEELNTYGLGSPFLFEFGVAVGMWTVNTKKGDSEGGGVFDDTCPAPSTTSPQNNPFSAAGNDIRLEKGFGGKPDGTNTSTENSGASPPKKGGYRQRGGANGGTPVPAPPQPTVVPAAAAAAAAPGAQAQAQPGGTPGSAKDDPDKKQSLAKRVGNFMQHLLTMMMTLFNPRPPEPELTFNPDKVIGNPMSHSIWVFLFILFAPIGVISSAIAGDNMSAVLHMFDPLLMLTFFLNILDILFNPLEIFMGGVYRPLLYRSLNTPFEVRGQSTFLQMAKVKPVDEVGGLIRTFSDIFTEGAGAVEEASAIIPATGIGKAGQAIGNAAGDTAAAQAVQAKAALVEAEAKARKSDAEAEAIKRGSNPPGHGETYSTVRTNPNGSKSGFGTMVGGFSQHGGGKSSDRSESSFDTLSLGTLGAVLVGGLLLGVSRSNVFQGKDDSPPVARRVRGA